MGYMSRGTPFHESILGKPLLIWVAISVENLPRPIPFRGLLLGLFFKLRSLIHAQERFLRFGVGIRKFGVPVSITASSRHFMFYPFGKLQ